MLVSEAEVVVSQAIPGTSDAGQCGVLLDSMAFASAVTLLAHSRLVQAPQMTCMRTVDEHKHLSG